MLVALANQVRAADALSSSGALTSDATSGRIKGHTGVLAKITAVEGKTWTVPVCLS